MKTIRILSFPTALAIATVASIFIGGLARAQTAAPAISATPITKVPFVITKPGLYMVKKDLVSASATGTAITISASNVTLDLGGHVLSGGTNNAGYGVRSYPNPTNITVRNGVIRNFSVGVELQNNYLGWRLVEDLVVANSGITGITITASSIEVRNCKVLDTGYLSSSGNTFGIAVESNDATVADNVVSNISTGPGHSSSGIVFSVLRGGVLENNLVVSNTTGTWGISCDSVGIFAVGNTITNFTNGLTIIGTGKYQGNLTKGCTTPFTGGTAVGTGNN
jgi:hypothetical protein